MMNEKRTPKSARVAKRPGNSCSELELVPATAVVAPVPAARGARLPICDYMCVCVRRTSTLEEIAALRRRRQAHCSKCC